MSKIANNLTDELKIEELLEKYPFAENFLNENMMSVKGFEKITFSEYMDMFTIEQIEDNNLFWDNIINFKNMGNKSIQILMTKYNDYKWEQK